MTKKSKIYQLKVEDPLKYRNIHLRVTNCIVSTTLLKVTCTILFSPWKNRIDCEERIECSNTFPIFLIL